ncbi:hypothetical protein GIX45_22915 [Erwinia sp. CPCC 100877]|nr:hypothetical protein [Erwinia sp. CPCC 100877]
MHIISRKADRLQANQDINKYHIIIYTFIITFILFIFTIVEKVVLPFFSTVEITQNKTEPISNREALDSQSYTLATPKYTQENNDSYFFLSNVSTLHNSTSKNLMISDGLIEIIDIKPLQKPEPEISYGIKNNKLITYIINNGSGHLKKTKFRLSAIIEDLNQTKIKLADKDIERLFQTNLSMDFSLQSGEIMKFFELNFSKELHELFEKNRNYHSIQLDILENSSKSNFKIHSIYYNQTEKNFVFGGMGAGSSAKTAVLLLDPNEPPQTYSVPINKRIEANSSEQVNLLLIPSQSSKVTYSIVYSMSNSKKTKPTKKIESTITVPLYDIGISPNSHFFQILLKNQVVHYQYNTNSNIQKIIGYDYKKALESH